MADDDYRIRVEIEAEPVEPALVVVLDLDPDPVVVVGHCRGAYLLPAEPVTSLGRDACAVFRERRASDAFRDSRLVEVLRNPTEEERIARAEDEAGVDVRGGGDNALVEQVADFVGERLQDFLAELL